MARLAAGLLLLACASAFLAPRPALRARAQPRAMTSAEQAGDAALADAHDHAATSAKITPRQGARAAVAARLNEDDGAVLGFGAGQLQLWSTTPGDKLMDSWRRVLAYDLPHYAAGPGGRRGGRATVAKKKVAVARDL